MGPVSPTPRPTVALLGADGNAFNVLGLCLRAARSAGWTDDEMTAWRERATAGDYDHLLGAVMEAFDVV